MTDAIDPSTVYQRVAAGERVSVLDIRDAEAYETNHLQGPGVEIKHRPYSRALAAALNGELAEELRADGLREPVIVVCAKGVSSAQVADLLRDNGVDAANLAGGMDAWGAFVTETTLGVPADGATVYQLCRPATGCLSYLVVAGGEAVAVDPLRSAAEEYVDLAASVGASLTTALDTHIHADHLSGIRSLRAATNATPTLPVGAEDRGLAFDAATVAEGDPIRVGDAELSIHHAPGHTSELVVVSVGSVLFTADCLFLDGVGRPDLEAGTDGAADLARELYRTLTNRLASFSDDTTVAPGHIGPSETPDDHGRYVASLGTLREQLSIFQEDESTAVERLTTDPPPRPANYETIIAVNLGQESIDVERAKEIELGPNNCAISSAE